MLIQIQMKFMNFWKTYVFKWLFPLESKHIKELELEREKILCGEISLKSLCYSSEDGQFKAELKTKFAEVLAVWCKNVVGDAPNYVEISLQNSDLPYEKYTVTVQRCEGLTPHQLRQIAENKLLECENERN